MNLHFTLPLDDLRKATDFVRHGLGGAAQERLDAHLFLFDLRGPLVTIFACSGELLARASIPVHRESKCTEDGSFAVLAKPFQELISSVSRERIIFTVDDQNAKIRAGDLRVNFATQAAVALRDAASPVPEEVVLQAKALPREMLVAALRCAKTWGAGCDALRPDLNHTEYRNGRFLASDGKRMMVYSPTRAQAGISLRVPNTVLNATIDALGGIKGEEVVAVAEPTAVYDYYYLYVGDRYLFGIQKLDKSFPDVEDKFFSWLQSDSEADDVVRVDRRYFANMVRGVSLGVDPDKAKNGSVRIHAAGTGAKASLTVVSENALGRVSFQRGNCGRKALDAISVSVSFAHLLDTLAAFRDQVVDIFIVKRGILLVRDILPEREVLTVIPLREGEEASEARWSAPLTAVEAELTADQKELEAAILAEQEAARKIAGPPFDLSQVVEAAPKKQ